MSNGYFSHPLHTEVEAIFQSLLEAAPDAMVIIDQDGNIVLINLQTEKLFGYTREELLGQKVELLVPEWYQKRPIGHRDGAFFDPRLRSIDAAPELFGRRKDGLQFPVEISLSPLETEKGVLITYAIRDITDRSKAEIRFRSLLESAPDSIVIVDIRGAIILVNAQTENLFGYDRKELLGQSMEMLVPARFRSVHAHHREGYVRTARPRPMGAGLELYGLRKDGTEFPVEISLSPLETEGDMLVVSAIRDITERLRLEEIRRTALEEQNRRMQEANRLKSEFLANMSHELRTPLNSIIGFAELIYDGRVGPLTTPQKEYLGDILTSSKHLLQVINAVLDLAKVESGKIEFRPEPVRLAHILIEVSDILRPLAAAKRIRMEIAVHPASLEAITDAGKLKQVLYNYLSNAIKFTAEEGQVTVRATLEGTSHFRLEVQDTGIGIREEDLPRLFVEFQQLDASASKRYQGTGLGLAITRRIVEAQGGAIGVESSIGQGSTFFAVLPLDGSDAARSTKDHPSAESEVHT